MSLFIHTWLRSCLLLNRLNFTCIEVFYVFWLWKYRIESFVIYRWLTRNYCLLLYAEFWLWRYFEACFSFIKVFRRCLFQCSLKPTFISLQLLLWRIPILVILLVLKVVLRFRCPIYIKTVSFIHLQRFFVLFCIFFFYLFRRRVVILILVHI